MAEATTLPDLKVIHPDPNFTANEVLASRGDADRFATAVSTSTEISNDLKRGQDRRKALDTVPLGREVFKRNTEFKKTPEHFDPKDEKTTKVMFGIGEASIDDITKTINLPTDPEALASYERANKIITEVSNYLSYAEVQARINKVGSTNKDKVLKEFGIVDGLGNPDTAKWDKMREKALDYILNLDYTQDRFSILKEIPTADKRREFLEETLALDPSLRNKIATGMENIRKQAEALPKVEDADPETVAAREKKKEAEEQIKFARSRLDYWMKEMGIADAADRDDMLDNVLSYNLKLGSDTGVAASLNQLNEAFIDNMSATNPIFKVMIAPSQQANIIAQAKAELAEAQEGKGRFRKMVDSVRSTKVRALQEKISTAEKAKELAEKGVSSIPLATRAVVEEQFRNLTSLNTNKVDKDGNYVSPLAQELHAWAKSNKDVTEAERTMAMRAPELGSKEKALKDERLRKEAALADQMEEMMADSISEVMLERYDENEKSWQIEMDEKHTEGVQKLKDHMKNNWSEYDEIKRRRTFKRGQIEKDILFAAYHGEDAIDRLLVRDLDLSPNWETMDLNKDLDSNQKALLEAAKKDYGPIYQKRLMSSFATARVTDRTIFGNTRKDYKLQPHEWDLLDQTFGSELNTVFKDANKLNGKDMWAYLESKGIDTRTTKGAWLLAVLAGLFASPVTAAAGPMGPGPRSS